MSDEKKPQKSAATELVEIAQDNYRFGATEDGQPFAVTQDPTIGRQHIALPLRGGRLSLRAELARRYFDAKGKAAPQQGLADALLILEGMAQSEVPEQLHVRVAQARGTTWIDMGDAGAHVIRMRGGEWALVDWAPSLFSRSALTAAMPTPQGSDLEALWRFVNVQQDDRPLLLGVMVAAFIEEMPHPIPTFHGEQGTGKSTATRRVVDLLDPSSVPLRKAPRDAEAWVTAARGSWLVAVDNISHMPDWFSDSLCRAVTGDGDVRRALYTDGGLAVFSFRRQVILTGIDFAGLNGDLAERLVTLQLERIPESQRRDETTLEAEWRQAYPAILGGLLDLAARIIDKLPSVRLDKAPRMADFARILAALDAELGTTSLDRYMQQARELAADTLAASSFVQALIEAAPADFEGTSSELLDLATPDEADWRKPKDWPRNSRAVTSILTRDAPALRKNGWQIDNLGVRNKRHTTLWRVAAPEMVREDARDTRQARPAAPLSGSSASQGESEARHGEVRGESEADNITRLSRANTGLGEAGEQSEQHSGQSHEDDKCRVCSTMLISPSELDSGLCSRTDHAHQRARGAAA